MQDNQMNETHYHFLLEAAVIFCDYDPTFIWTWELGDKMMYYYIL